MITELTQAQMDLLPAYRDKWLAKGLRTDPFAHDEARDWAQRFVVDILKRKKPKAVVVLNSPLSAWIGTWMLSCQVGGQVRDQVRDQVWGQVGGQVWGQVGDQVGGQVWDQVRDQVRDQVWGQVWGQVEDQVGGQVGVFVWPNCSGRYWAGWYGFYEYFRNVVGLKYNCPQYDLFLEGHKYALVYPLTNGIVVMSQHPQEIHMHDGRLHRDGGPAVSYGDGFAVWALNGVRVPQELAETPAEKLDAQKILTEKNAEVRREYVRKMGVELVCQRLGAEVKDSTGDYELLSLDLQDGRYRPYLKMLNPSIGTYHIEGVHPDCRTVEQALCWRNQTDEQPVVLT